MKRISILACILSMWFVVTAGAQQTRSLPDVSKHLVPGHRLWNAMQKHARANSQTVHVLDSATDPTVWELGNYPNGTWAGLQATNDFGVAIGWGDVPIEEGTETRMVGVPVLGFYAGQWFQSGVTAGENDLGEAGGISNTGTIVGNIMDSNGWPEAYAWTPNHGGVRLGKYSDANGVDDGSIAIAINHSGTLIVGNSGKLLPDGTTRAKPIVWTSAVTWNNGQPTLSWELHALPTGGLEKLGAVFSGIALNAWGGWGVNDSGQIAGDGWYYDPNLDEWWEIAVVWTPINGGKGWKIQRLPNAAGIGYNEALAINNLGEIVGDVWDQNAFPALYKQDPRNNKWSVSVLPNTTPDLTYGWSVA